MNYSRIRTSTSGRVATITLDRPEKRNVLDETMVGELAVAFRTAEQDPSAKVALLTGNGPAFCAGADLGYLTKLSAFTYEQNREDSGALADLFKTIYTLKKPVIAVVRGPALAGGCGLATVCDIVIASEEKAQFGYTEVRLGFIPAIVMTFLIRRVGEGRARSLVLRGNIIDAREAERIGLVNIACPDSAIESVAEQICSDMLENNSLQAMAECKKLIAEIGNRDVSSALPIAADFNARVRMTEECRSAMKNFLAKRKTAW